MITTDPIRARVRKSAHYGGQLRRASLGDSLWEHGVSKISVLLSKGEDERFSAYCSERGYKKSTLIARLIREHLDREGFPAQPPLFGAPNRRPE